SSAFSTRRRNSGPDTGKQCEPRGWDSSQGTGASGLLDSAGFSLGRALTLGAAVGMSGRDGSACTTVGLSAFLYRKTPASATAAIRTSAPPTHPATISAVLLFFAATA